MGSSITDVEMEKISLDIDQDRNGYIEYEEFLRVALNKNTLLSKENLKLAFENFDADGDGTLTAEEIKNILGTKNNEYFDKLLLKIDQNKDGLISFQEFSMLMNSILLSKGQSSLSLTTLQKSKNQRKKWTYQNLMKNKLKQDETIYFVAI